MVIFVIIVGGALGRAMIIVLIIGFVISLFEEFYVQGRSGRWLRAMHPAKSIVVYSLLIVGFAMTVMVVVGALLGPLFGAEVMSERPATMPSMLIGLPVMFAVSVTALMTLRIIGYLVLVLPATGCQTDRTDQLKQSNILQCVYCGHRILQSVPRLRTGDYTVIN